MRAAGAKALLLPVFFFLFLNPFFLQTPSLQAAASCNFTVTNTNDSGGSSLRDALTQANANPDTSTVCFAIPGIYLTASGNIRVTGLIINRFVADGIFIDSTGSVVTGNYIGTDASGTVARGNSTSGVGIFNGVGNTVGGATPVVGNWNGDGTDTPGIVVGNTWLLRNSNDTGVANFVFNFGFPGAIPFAWK
ncbi:MAG: hypothetical protein ACYCXL_06110 [Thermoleophilia bacterium]